MRSWLLALAVMGCTPVATQATEDTLTEAAPVVLEAALPSEVEDASAHAVAGIEEEVVWADAAKEVTLDEAALPPAVVAFVESRDACEHLMGEFVGDPEIDGPRGINQQIEAACIGLDERLTALKAKHQADAAAMAVLNEYELLY